MHSVHVTPFFKSLESLIVICPKKVTFYLCATMAMLLGSGSGPLRKVGAAGP
jgi:hypothetical protein